MRRKEWKRRRFVKCEGPRSPAMIDLSAKRKKGSYGYALLSNHDSIEALPGMSTSSVSILGKSNSNSAISASSQ